MISWWGWGLMVLVVAFFIYIEPKKKRGGVLDQDE